MRKTSKLLSITIVLGMLVSMLSGFSVVANAGEITASYDAQQSTEEKAVITFSEAIADGSSIKLYDTETLEMVPVGAEKLSELAYGFALTGLKSGAEYVIKVPAGIPGTTSANTTIAGEIYFNVADEAVISGKAGEILSAASTRFDDTFDSYGEISDSAAIIQKLTTEAGAAGVKRWYFFNGDVNTTEFQTKSLNGSIGLYSDLSGTAAKDYYALACQDYVNGDEFIKSGITDIYFDMAFGNPNTTNEPAVQISLGTNGTNYSYPVFKIHGSGTMQIFANNWGIWNKDIGRDDKDITTVEKYKVTVDYENLKVSVARYNGTSYVELGNKALDTATIGELGFRGVQFQAVRTATTTALADGTGVFFDNLSIVQREKVAPYEFEDDFSSYTPLQTAPAVNSNNITNIPNPKWKVTSDGWNGWGRGLYPYSLNGNKVLRIDLWQSVENIETRGTTIIGDEAIKTGIAEFTFDAAVQNPQSNVDNGYANSFIVGFDGGDAANHPYPYPVIEIATKAIKAYKTVDFGEYITSSYENPNNLTDFNSYKIVADFTRGTVSSYVKNGAEYALIYNATMPDAIKTNGINGMSFAMTKAASAGALEQNTSALIDNVKVDIMEKDIAPVVKSVRIDEAAASDSVAIDAQEIKIYFNKPMNEASLSAITVGGVATPGVYNNADCSYTITLPNDFAPLTDYTISVPASVTDATLSAKAVRAYSGKFRTASGVFRIESIYLKEGAVDATLANTQAGDTLKAGVSITNSAQNAGEYVLICVVYDGDMLSKIDYVKVPFNASTTTVEKDIDFTIPQTTGQLGVKIMLWESFQTLTPIESAITLD